MPNEKDIFEKMDALVRKHHPAPAQPAMITPPPAKQISTRIPTLTDIIQEPTLEAELEQDLIPLLTEAVLPVQTQPDELTLELDLDPFFTITAPETPVPTPDIPAEQDPPAVSEEAYIISAFPKLEGPLFTDIIELNAPPPATQESLTAAPQDTIPAIPTMSADAFAQFSETLSEQVMHILDQRLQQAVDKKIAPQIAQTVDKALSSMLDQFGVNIEYMVREAIAQELQRQLTALLSSSDNHKSTP